MSAVGYEGHIWEELFGSGGLKKFLVYIMALIIVAVVIILYLALR